jgi:UDP-glucose 4-epimerase
MIFDGKRILITGGTGSLGSMVLTTILSGVEGRPARIRIFSRDESKQFFMQKEYAKSPVLIEYKIGDVRCYQSVLSAVAGMDIVINAAALKHVPACENDPWEAVRTNIEGPENIIRAVKACGTVEKVLGISTDKACAPTCVMGMTKAIQERLFIQANNNCDAQFSMIRFGNMLESRGSVVPIFRQQIAKGGPVTVTHRNMTRFFVTLKSASEHLIMALKHNKRGQIYIPRMRSAYIDTLATVLIHGDRKIDKVYTGIRPGEKLEDIIISENESPYVQSGENCFFLNPAIHGYPAPDLSVIPWKYGSADQASLMNEDELCQLIRSN